MAPAPVIDFPAGDDLAADEKFAVFERWLIENGSVYPKLELKDYGNEVRGCHATSDIDNNETIISIPLKCLITVEMGKQTSIGRAIIDANVELDAPKHIFIMIFMLIDRLNPKSFFKPYYDILPATLRNMPVFWNEDELSYLEGSFLLTQIAERNLAMENDYESICKVAPEFREVSSLNDFKWARMCVCSRNFGLVVNGLRTAAMVPYADMLNHYRPRETKWQFEDSSQAFTIVSLRDIESGGQVYDSYGQKCNHRFLLNYGFSVENNEELDGFNPNEVPILLQLRKEDTLSQEKCNFWRKDGSFPSRRIRVCIGDNENSRAMLSILRIINADQDDFNQLTQSPSSTYRTLRGASFPLNSKNEIKAMTHLKEIVEDYLGRYPTTLEEDKKRLAAKGPGALPQFSNERHAIIQVTGEKEVLVFLRDFAETALKVLSLLVSDGVRLESAMEEVLLKKHAVISLHCRTIFHRLRRIENSGTNSTDNS